MRTQRGRDAAKALGTASEDDIRAALDEAGYERDESHAILGKHSDLINVQIFFLTLVLIAPIYTYEPATKDLVPTDSVILLMSVDGPSGLVTRLVHVVSLDGMPALIERHRRAAADVQTYISSPEAFSFALQGAAQRQAYRDEG